MSHTANEQLIKTENESRLFSMDFVNLLKSGETISTINYLGQYNKEGLSDLAVGIPAVVGSEILFTIGGGTNNKRYRIIARITTSLGNILEGFGVLKISDK